MGVASGVAVAREVLGCGQHPVLLQTPDLRRNQAANGVGVFAKGTDIDDRIGGVVVDVGHRREGEVNAHRAAL
jgi:hypothetical protein